MRRTARFACAWAVFAAGTAAAAVSAQTPVTVAVDAAADRHPISPLVYGVAYGDAASLSDLNCPLNRLGGNNTSRYNWQVERRQPRRRLVFREHRRRLERDAGRASATRSSRRARPAGAQPMLTIPMIGWVAQARRQPRRSSRASRSRSTARRRATTGSGIPTPATACSRAAATSPATIRPTPTCSSTRRSSRPGSQHLVGDVGAGLHRRPALLHSRQRASHLALDASRRPSRPAPTMDEIRRQDDRLRRTDQGRRTPAPSSSARRSGAGAATSTAATTSSTGAAHGWSSLPDRAAHGNARLSAVAARRSCRPDGIRHGRRLLDVFTVHYYPQGGEFGNDVSAGDAAAPQPFDALALGSELRRRDLDQRQGAAHPASQARGSNTYYYPARQIGITEYNWGAEAHINGATDAGRHPRHLRPRRVSTSPRAGRRRTRPRRPTRPSRCTATTTARSPRSATRACGQRHPIPTRCRPSRRSVRTTRR